MSNASATLTFPSLELAQAFEVEWTRFTLEGRDRGAVASDGSVKVTVYNLDDERKAWIEAWVKANS